MGLGGGAVAQQSEPLAKKHPVVGEIAARDFTNAQLMALPEQERLAWIHGAATMAAQMAASKKPEIAGCLTGAFTDDGNASDTFDEAAKKYPDMLATVTLFAVGRLACPALVDW